MNILFGIFVFFLATWLIFRIFGRQIMQFLLKQVFKQVVKDTQKDYQSYQKHYEKGTYEENIYVDDEIKVSAPKRTSASRSASLDEIVEDVNFEEVKAR